MCVFFFPFWAKLKSRIFPFSVHFSDTLPLLAVVVVVVVGDGANKCAYSS